MNAIESLKKNILTECDDDHVGIWSIIREVEDCMPKQDESLIRERVLKLLKELLVANEIKAGYPTKDGKFKSLRITPNRVVDRIDEEWPSKRRPTIGEGLWFTRVRRKNDRKSTG